MYIVSRISFLEKQTFKISPDLLSYSCSSWYNVHSLNRQSHFFTGQRKIIIWQKKRSGLWRSIYMQDNRSIYIWTSGSHGDEHHKDEEASWDQVSPVRAVHTSAWIKLGIICSGVQACFTNRQHEIHETCHSVTFYFMSKLIFWYHQKVHFTKYDWGS